MRGPVITIAPSAMLNLVSLGPPGPLDYVVRLAVRGVVYAEVSAVSSLSEHCRLVLTSIVRHSLAAAHQHQPGSNRGRTVRSTCVRRQLGYERQHDYRGLDRSRGRPAAHVQVSRVYLASRHPHCVVTARGCVAQVFCIRTGCVRSGADRGPEEPSMGTALPCHGPSLERMEHVLMLGCILNVCDLASPEHLLRRFQHHRPSVCGRLARRPEPSESHLLAGRHDIGASCGGIPITVAGRVLGRWIGLAVTLVSQSHSACRR